MTKSMTAYARQEEKLSVGNMAIEVRSVNHRFLEVSIKLPDDLRALEIPLRNQIKATLKRGKVDVTLLLHLEQDEQHALSFNYERAQQVAKTLHDIDKLIYNAAPVNALDILTWPGVMDTQSLDLDIMKETSSALLDRVLTVFLADKEREGKALEVMIHQRVAAMRKLTHQIRQQMPELLQWQRKRLEEKLNALSVELDHDRLEQEIVYLAQKADVAEELDRLDTHLDEIERTLTTDDAIGRRLDFLMQELHREANTLGSKSIANVMTQVAIEMKVLIEQMREQIQNIE